MSGEVKEGGEAVAVAKTVPSLEELIVALNTKVEAVRADISTIIKAEAGMEFSKEDRAVIISAFKSVHSALGTAFGVLAEKDISYKAQFDSKRGVLTVQLFKMV